MTLIDSLVISLGLDPKDVDKGMKQASSTIDKGIKNIVGNLLAPLAAAFAGGALVKDYLNTADAVGKMSESLGVNIEDMQAWGEAAKRSGGTAEGFYSTLENLNQKIQETAATGKGEGAEIFKQLGVSAKNAKGEVVQTTDLLIDLAGQAEKMGREKFVGFAKKLGIDAGTIKLLQSGKKGVEELIQRQKALGVYTKEDAEIAARANDAFADLTQVFKATAAVALRVLIPPIAFVTEKVTDLFTYLRKHQAIVVVVFSAIAGVIVAKLVPAFLAMGLAAAKAMLPLLPWIIAIGALALIIDDLVTYMQGGKSAFEGFWASLGTPEELMAIWKNIKDGAKELFDFLGTTLIPVLKELFKLITMFALAPLKAVMMLINAFKEIGPALDALQKWFENAHDYIAEKLESLFGWITKIKDAISGGIKGFFGIGSNSEPPSGTQVSAQDALVAGGAASTSNSVTNDTDVRIEKIEVVVPEGNPNAIGNGIGSSVQQNLARKLTNAANTGAN